MLKPSLGTLSFCALSLATFVAACSSSDSNDTGTIVRKDTGVGTPQDAGDSGTGGGDTGTVADTGSQPDTGIVRPDATAGDTGFRPDASGPGPDGGTMLTPCTMSAQCTALGANAVCIDRQPDRQGNVNICNGCANGACVVPCDWAVRTPGCPAQNFCAFLGTGSNVPGAGACQTGSGGTQAQACMIQVDATGGLASDSCNRSDNFICRGATADEPNGRCARLCRPGAGEMVCASLGNYTCSTLATGVGICINPTIESVMDVGRACPAAPATCQGGLCSPPIMSCSAPCGGLGERCPTMSTCVQVAGMHPFCAYNCTAGAPGDMACMARNPATPSCFSLGGTPPVAVCVPAM